MLFVPGLKFLVGHFGLDDFGLDVKSGGLIPTSLRTMESQIGVSGCIVATSLLESYRSTDLGQNKDALRLARMSGVSLSWLSMYP